MRHTKKDQKQTKEKGNINAECEETVKNSDNGDGEKTEIYNNYVQNNTQFCEASIAETRHIKKTNETAKESENTKKSYKQISKADDSKLHEKRKETYYIYITIYWSLISKNRL